MNRLFGFLVFSLLLANCSRPVRSSGDIFRVPISAIPDLELKYGDDINGNKIVANVFERLVSLDESLAPVPDLAASWKITADKNEIEFQIKSTKRFHDGSTVTSTDVLNSFIRSAKNTSKFTSQFQSFEDCVQGAPCVSFKILSPTRFILRLNGRNFELLMKNLASAEASIMKKVGDRYYGTGPYKITQIDVEQIVAEKFDDRAQFKKIIFRKTTPDGAIKMFLAGEVDTISDLESPISKTLVTNNPYIRKIGGTYALVFQCDRGIFRKKENRLAVASAINIDELQRISERDSIPAGGMIPRGYVGYTEKRHPLNVEMAQKLISRNTNLTERKVTLGVRETLTGSKAFKQYLVSVFKNIGLELEIRSMSFDAMLRDIRLRKIDMILKGEAPVNFDPSTSFIGYANGLSQRLQGYTSKELASLFSEYQSKTTKPEQIETLKKMEAAFFDDVPAIPLFYPIFTTWYRPGLHIKNEGSLTVKFWDFSYQDIQGTAVVRN